MVGWQGVVLLRFWEGVGRGGWWLIGEWGGVQSREALPGMTTPATPPCLLACSACLLGGLGLLDDEGLLPREGVVHLPDDVAVADGQALELRGGEVR